MKKILVLLFITSSLLSQEPANNNDSLLPLAGPVTRIANALHTLTGIAIRRNGYEHRLETINRQRELSYLIAEDNLYDCLAKNARAEKGSDDFPLQCEKCVDEFNKFAPDESIEHIKKEFILAVKSLPEKKIVHPKTGMSKKAKVAIGVAAGTGLAAGAFFATPVILPGTVVAAKASFVIAKLKAAATLVAVKTTQASLTTKLIVAGTAVNVANNLSDPKKVFSLVSKAAYNMPLEQKIRIAAVAADTITVVATVTEGVVDLSSNLGMQKLKRTREKKGNLTERIHKSDK